jgi:hypothetical protein
MQMGFYNQKLGGRVCRHLALIPMVVLKQKLWRAEHMPYIKKFNFERAKHRAEGIRPWVVAMTAPRPNHTG